MSGDRWGRISRTYDCFRRVAEEHATAFERTQPQFPPLCITFLGIVNSGKSSLINEVLGFNLVRVQLLACTPCLIVISRSRDDRNYIRLDGGEPIDPDGYEDHETLAEELRNYCDGLRDLCVLGSIVNVEIHGIPIIDAGITIVDTPGFNETPEVKKIVMEFVKKSAVVVFIVPDPGVGIAMGPEFDDCIATLQKENISPTFVVNKIDDEANQQVFITDLYEVLRRKFPYCVPSVRVSRISPPELESRSTNSACLQDEEFVQRSMIQMEEHQLIHCSSVMWEINFSTTFFPLSCDAAKKARKKGIPPPERFARFLDKLAEGVATNLPVFCRRFLDSCIADDEFLYRVALSCRGQQDEQKALQLDLQQMEKVMLKVKALCCSLPILSLLTVSLVPDVVTLGSVFDDFFMVFCHEMESLVPKSVLAKFVSKCRSNFCRNVATKVLQVVSKLKSPIQVTTKCPKGHLLQPIPSTDGRSFTCNGCHADTSTPIRCDKCDYDLCDNVMCRTSISKMHIAKLQHELIRIDIEDDFCLCLSQQWKFYCEEKQASRPIIHPTDILKHCKYHVLLRGALNSFHHESISEKEFSPLAGPTCYLNSVVKSVIVSEDGRGWVRREKRYCYCTQKENKTLQYLLTASEASSTPLEEDHIRKFVDSSFGTTLNEHTIIRAVFSLELTVFFTSQNKKLFEGLAWLCEFYTHHTPHDTLDVFVDGALLLVLRKAVLNPWAPNNTPLPLPHELDLQCILTPKVLNTLNTIIDNLEFHHMIPKCGVLLRLLKESLNFVPKVSEGSVAYCIPTPTFHVEKLHIGMVLYSHGITMASYDCPEGEESVFEIQLSNAYDVGMLELSDRDTVVLLPGSKFEVIEVKQTDCGPRHVVFRQIA